MRCAPSVGVVIGVDDKALGLFLESDYVSEHEWGIKGIRRHFGLTPMDDAIGIGRYTITPTTLEDMSKQQQAVYRTFRHKGVEYTCLYIGNVYPHIKIDTIKEWFSYADNSFRSVLPYEQKNRNGEVETIDACGAWCEDSFALVTTGESAAFLRQWIKALEEGHATIHIFGSPNPFGRGGLCLSIDDLWPDKEELVKRHQREALEKKIKEGELAPILNKINKLYAEHKMPHQGHASSLFCCSPSISDEPIEGSSKNYRCWLNDGVNYFGWVTYEDLLDLAKGKGRAVEIAKAHTEK